MNLGMSMRALRQECGWTQEELAFRCDTTAATISRMEAGKLMPSWNMLIAIASAFDTPVYRLLALAEGVLLPTKPVLYDQREDDLLAFFRAMPVDKKEIFLRLGGVLASP